MDEEIDLNTLMQDIAAKSLKLLSANSQKSLQIPDFLQQFMEILNNYQSTLLCLLKNPEKIMQMQFAYWQDAFSLSQEQFNYWLQGKPMPIDDKRFNSEEWINNPFFNLLSQHYLLASEHMKCLLTQIDCGDAQLGKKIRFFTTQYLDALSPANFLQTNPQLLAETIQSHGKNLLLGLQNMLNDMEDGSSSLVMKMTDTEAFKIGENIAATPGKVIFRNALMELIQYTPQTKKVREIPLLIIPPWINKYYILDLSAHNSLMSWLVKQGLSVFVISWVNPDQKYADKGLYEYLHEGPQTAIEIIKKQMQVPQVNVLGFCIGGTLLTCLLAYYKATGENPIKSATFLASLIDFSEPGDIAVFIDEQQIEKIEKTMQEKGFLEGQFMVNTFNSLRSNDLIWSFFIKNYLKGQKAVPFDILYWNADATNMPAKMHSEYLRGMYLHNNLIKKKGIVLNKVPLDIHKIDVPSFFIATQKDHIAPWQTVYRGFLHLKGNKEFLLGESGHIAGIINAPNNKKYGFYYNNKVAKTAEQWLEHAHYQSDSWWPYWFKWLVSHSGEEIKSKTFKQLAFKPLSAAPGEYIFMKY